MTSFHERLVAAVIAAEQADNGPDHFQAVLALRRACPPQMVQTWENGMAALRFFVDSFPGNQAGALGNGKARRAYDQQREALAVYDAQVAALQEENDA